MGEAQPQTAIETLESGQGCPVAVLLADFQRRPPDTLVCYSRKATFESLVATVIADTVGLAIADSALEMLRSGTSRIDGWDSVWQGQPPRYWISGLCRPGSGPLSANPSASSFSFVVKHFDKKVTQLDSVDDQLAALSDPAWQEEVRFGLATDIHHQVMFESNGALQLARSMLEGKTLGPERDTLLLLTHKCHILEVCEMEDVSVLGNLTNQVFV